MIGQGHHSVKTCERTVITLAQIVAFNHLPFSERSNLLLTAPSADLTTVGNTHSAIVVSKQKATSARLLAALSITPMCVYEGRGGGGEQEGYGSRTDREEKR